MPRLIITAPDGKRGLLEISRPLTTIGRGSSNDLVLADSSVSRYHAVLKRAEQGFVIADRGSTNGVLIGGERVGAEHPLRHGDVFHVGAYALKFESREHTSLVIREAE